MTHFLDQALDSADDLVELLADADGDVDEGRVEALAGMLVADVKHHNDRLAEQAWEGDD